MYIDQKIGDTGDPCGIPVSNLCLRLINLSILSSTHLSDNIILSTQYDHHLCPRHTFFDLVLLEKSDESFFEVH